MNKDLDAHYELIQNVDCSETTEWNDGKGFMPVGSDTRFSGSIDGNGFVVKNLYINRTDSEEYLGLLGHSMGLIENIGIIDSQISSRGSVVGGLVGSSTGNGALIKNSYSKVKVTSYTKNAKNVKAIGGLVGINHDNSVVSNSFSNSTVEGDASVGGLVGNNQGKITSSSAAGTISGLETSNPGGLVGSNMDDGVVIKSYSSAEISGLYPGGLVGDNHGVIKSSYSKGKVSGKSAGGLVGVNMNGGNVGDDGKIVRSFSTTYVSGSDSLGGLVGSNGGKTSSVYWDINTSNQTRGVNATGLYTDQMTGEAAKNNMYLYFGEVWETVPGDYPRLKWQDTTVAVNPQKTSTYPNDTVKLNLVVNHPWNGVGAIDAKVSLDKNSKEGNRAHEIKNFSLNGDPGMKTVNVSQNGLSTSLDAALMDTKDEGMVEVADFKVKVGNWKQTDLSLDVEAVGTEEGASYEYKVEDGLLEVKVIPKLRESYSGKPSDRDGDGIYRNLNGDTNIDVVDVQALYKTRDDKTIQRFSEAFDMNQDGKVDIVDVQRLYNELNF